MSKKRSKPSPAPAVQREQPETGPDRFTVFRFLSDCADATREYLLAQWAEGNQLESGRVPVDGLPPVVILATYARSYGVELVDDFEVLIDKYRDNIRDCAHPDKFFASCCSLLFDRGMYPDEVSFQSINIPSIYEELFP